MLWPRQSCPFGLPDDDEDEAVGDIVAVSIGHVLRATATDIVDAPLPVQLAGLLRRLARRERSALGNATLRRNRAVPCEAVRRTVQRRPADASPVAADVVGLSSLTTG